MKDHVMFDKFVVGLLLGIALAAALGTIHTVRAQELAITVADGVYTDAQATRGAASYDTSCSGCHRADLGGATGPALKEQRFSRDFAGKDLKTLFTKVATTMPRNAPATLGDNVYFDIVAHILKENGFPAGAGELTTDVLDARVLPGRPKAPPPVTDFSYVETAGCLTLGPNGTWLLTNAKDPVVVVLPAGAGHDAKDMKPAPRGSQTFRLLDAMAYDPEAHKGQEMYVRGVLVKLPSEQRMTISAFESIAPNCSN